MSGVYVLVCLLLVLIVLLQQGKGGDIAAAFGGGGTQAAFGARAGATLLTRATTVLGALFMIGALVLAIMGQRGARIGGRRHRITGDGTAGGHRAGNSSGG